MVDFGFRIRTLRKKNNLTQSQLAERLGVTKSVISAYENDLRLPSYDTLIAISRIFKVSTDYLLGVEQNNGLDVSGLTATEVSALKTLMKAMRNG